VRTAFGELVAIESGPESRYGYAGVWGYQQHDIDNDGQGDGKPDTVVNTSATTGLPFLHVGARYYDPSTGRFLQRDPIGLRGGANVYAYVANSPVGDIDPSGLDCSGAEMGTFFAGAIKEALGSKGYGFPPGPVIQPATPIKPPAPTPMDPTISVVEMAEAYAEARHPLDAAFATIFIAGVGIPAGAFADGMLMGMGCGWLWNEESYEPGDITRGVLKGTRELWK
jgi:RHS repeat-associated protein